MHKILVCDDEKDIVSALKIYLSMGDYEVLEAYNGQPPLEVPEAAPSGDTDPVQPGKILQPDSRRPD